MAQITTLKNREGMALYPLTSSKAVLDEGGVDMDTRLAGKVEKVPGKGLSSNDFSDAEKLKLEGLPTSGVLEERFAGKQEALQDSADVVLCEGKLTVTEAAKRQLFVDQWNEAAGEYGCYNEQSGFFELNGITDITYEEALGIYSLYPICNNTTSKRYAFARLPHRTFFPIRLGENIHTMDIMYAFLSCRNLEVVRVVIQAYNYSNYSLFNKAYYYRNAFSECYQLKRVLGEINLSDATDAESAWPLFSKCYKLEDFRLRGVHLGLNLKDCSKVNRESLAFLIQYATNTSAMIITVHGDVYAKLTGDTSNAAAAELTTEELAAWGAVLAAAVGKNISFASA